MSDCFHFVSPVLAVMLLLAAAGAVGEMILSRLRPEVNSRTERVALSMTLGLGVLAAVMFLLGLAGFFTRAAMLAVQAIAIAMYLFTRRAHVASIRVRPPWLLASVLFLMIAPMLVLALYPTVEWDSLQYHLPLIQAHLRSGRIEPAMHLHFPVFPQLIEILCALPMAASNDLAPQFLNVAFLLLACLWLFAFGKRHDHELTGWWSASLYLSFPIVVWFAGTADIDAGLALFTTAAVFSVLNGLASRQAGWMTVAGFFAGSMAAAKYTGLFVVCCLAVAILVLGKRRELLRFLLPAAVAAVPCYAFITWHTGDPVWPAAQRLFGYWFWTPGDVATQGNDLLQYGTAHTAQALAALPWNLAFHADLFDAIKDRAWTFLLLALAPFGLLARNPVARPAAILFLAAVAGWFFSAQVVRYLVPVLPLGCFLAAFVIRNIIARAGALRWFDTPLARTLACAALMFTGTWSAGAAVADSGPLPASAPARDAWYQHFFPNYEVTRFMNRRAGANYTLYVIWGEDLNAWAKGTILGQMNGTWRYARMKNALDDDEDHIARELRDMGADYLAIYVKGLGWNTIRAWPAWKQLRPVFGSDYDVIFQLSSAPPRAGPEPKIIPINRHLGRGDMASCDVPVEAQQLYAFTVQVRPQEKVAYLAASVTWLDQHFQSLEKFTLDFPIVGNSTDAPFFLTSPPGAARAFVILSRDKRVPIDVESILVRRLATDG